MIINTYLEFLVLVESSPINVKKQYSTKVVDFFYFQIDRTKMRQSLNRCTFINDINWTAPFSIKGVF